MLFNTARSALVIVSKKRLKLRNEFVVMRAGIKSIKKVQHDLCIRLVPGSMHASRANVD